MKMAFFKHEQAIVESKNVGKGTRVWAFAHVLPGAVIGRDCNICDHVFVENDVKVGDRVTVKCGVQLWDGLRVENDVFIGPNATFTNDAFPRSKQYPEAFAETVIGEGASIGANATILPGIKIGRRAMIGAGAVVTRNVPANAIVTGNPARITGYVGLEKRKKLGGKQAVTHLEGVGSTKSLVPGVQLVRFPVYEDLRGSLTVGEFPKEVPFLPKRYFMTFGIPTAEVRGEHAHHKLQQFLVCVAGNCSVVVDDGSKREEFLLNGPELGLYLPPMVWGIQYKFSSDAVLLVFASDPYDSKDYIRDYDEFLKLKSAKRKA